LSKLLFPIHPKVPGIYPDFFGRGFRGKPAGKCSKNPLSAAQRSPSGDLGVRATNIAVHMDKRTVGAKGKFLEMTMLTIIFMLFSFGASAQSDSLPEKPSKISFKGYIKDLQSASFVNNANQVIATNLIHNRLMFTYDFDSSLRFDAEMRNRLYYGSGIGTNILYAQNLGADNGYFNLSKTLVNAQSVLLYSTFDRLNLEWKKGRWDITAGRQRINWGIALAWNPNDIFNAYNFLDFDYEERPGNDALRVQYATGSFSGIEAAYRPGRKADETIAAALYKFNARGYDFQVLGGLYNKTYMAGAGWAGNIKDAGFKGEISYFRSRNNFKDTTGTMELSVSLDQSFNPGWYVSLSALYNSKGQLDHFNLATVTNTLLDASNLFPFKYSVYGGLTKTFSPIFNGNFGVLYAPGINAFIFIPTLSYSISNSWNADLIGQSFFADLNGKFQTAGNAVFLRFRWSF
jgi:hypothetical protein